MSRVGRQAIKVPAAAKVAVRDGAIHIEGPKGKLRQALVDGVDVVIDGATVSFTRASDEGPARARHGMLRSIVANGLRGVTEGFKRELEISGVGYRAELKGRELHLALGFSHPVVYRLPEGVAIEVDKQTRLMVSGADKQAVGQVCAELRGLRPPDAYKGKGIKYAGEVLKLKEGKSAAGGKA